MGLPRCPRMKGNKSVRRQFDRPPHDVGGGLCKSCQFGGNLKRNPGWNLFEATSSTDWGIGSAEDTTRYYAIVITAMRQVGLQRISDIELCHQLPRQRRRWASNTAT